MELQFPQRAGPKRSRSYLGLLGVMDTPRPAAAAVMRSLRELEIQRLIMISRANQRVAEAVAASVGLTEARDDLMPEHMVDAIWKLREKKVWPRGGRHADSGHHLRPEHRHGRPVPRRIDVAGGRQCPAPARIKERGAVRT